VGHFRASACRIKGTPYAEALSLWWATPFASLGTGLVLHFAQPNPRCRTVFYRHHRKFLRRPRRCFDGFIACLHGISVDLTNNGTNVANSGFERQDFSLQNATTLPLNDARAFLSTMKMITAANPLRGLWSLSLPDQLSVLRTLVLAQIQARQSVKHYQQLRYWSTVPFRHGPVDVVKQSATPSRDNPSHALLRSNPDALQDELVRHLEEDSVMSSFDIGLQFLDTERITYWGERQDASFWIENASVEWKETEAPFHSVARLTLTPKSRLSSQASEAIYFDVTGNATPDSAPVGSINRVRCSSEAASRKARTHANAASEAELLSQCQR
jgi:hypothetical protein